MISSGSYWWYYVSLYFNINTNTAQMYVRNTYTIEDIGTVSIAIICIKDI